MQTITAPSLFKTALSFLGFGSQSCIARRMDNCDTYDVVFDDALLDEVNPLRNVIVGRQEPELKLDPAGLLIRHFKHALIIEAQDQSSVDPAVRVTKEMDGRIDAKLESAIFNLSREVLLNPAGDHYVLDIENTERLEKSGIWVSLVRDQTHPRLSLLILSAGFSRIVMPFVLAKRTLAKDMDCA